MELELLAEALLVERGIRFQHPSLIARFMHDGSAGRLAGSLRGDRGQARQLAAPMGVRALE
jgi:hypothetical protein